MQFFLQLELVNNTNVDVCKIYVKTKSVGSLSTIEIWLRSLVAKSSDRSLDSPVASYEVRDTWSESDSESASFSFSSTLLNFRAHVHSSQFSEQREVRSWSSIVTTESTDRQSVCLDVFRNAILFFSAGETDTTTYGDVLSYEETN